MRTAFSLVELSIVLVILGLLTGGILSGQSLIRAAELRGGITQLTQYHASIYTFRDKYFGIPGDLSNATAFWGSKGGNGSNDACYSVNATGSPTCNGDGNGLIETSSTATGNNIWAERFLGWQHLANAGLVEGSYIGKTNGGSNLLRAAGVNVPQSKMSNAMLELVGVLAKTATDPNWYATDQTNYINIIDTAGNGVMLPEEMWNVDTKLDDGLPGLGKLRTYKDTSAFGPNCSDADNQTTAKYDFLITAKNCRILYQIN